MASVTESPSLPRLLENALSEVSPNTPERHSLSSPKPLRHDAEDGENNMSTMEDDFSVFDDDDFSASRRQSGRTSIHHSLFSASSPMSEHFKADAPHQQRSPFRNPSSVRAMQMSTTPPLGFSPSDRLRSTSIRTTDSLKSRSPKKDKEFPLILLHVTLLPVNLPYPDSLLMQVLPEATWDNLTMLRTKINSTTLDRGVLVPHPRDDYSLLEERLLESLDLRTPRILKCGHFHHPPSPSSSEDGSAPPSPICEARENGKICPDCNRHIKLSQPLSTGSGNTKWEIRVFASNGLMRAGAWVAAWRDMESVDVEILPWISNEMKQELEGRRVEMEARQREAELIDEAEIMQDSFEHTEEHLEPEPAPIPQSAPFQEPLYSSPAPAFPYNLQGATIEEAIHIIIAEARRFISQYDHKTLTIAVLSLLVLFLAASGGNSAKSTHIEAPKPVAPTSTVIYSCAAPPPAPEATAAAASIQAYDREDDPGLTEEELEDLFAVDGVSDE